MPHSIKNQINHNTSVSGHVRLRHDSQQNHNSRRFSNPCPKNASRQCYPLGHSNQPDTSISSGVARGAALGVLGDAAVDAFSSCTTSLQPTSVLSSHCRLSSGWQRWQVKGGGCGGSARMQAGNLLGNFDHLPRIFLDITIIPFTS